MNNFGGYTSSQQPFNAAPAQPPLVPNGIAPQIEREATLRRLDRMPTYALPPQAPSKEQSFLSQSFSGGSRPAGELNRDINRVSNRLYMDNQPTVEYPNDPYWFGRTGKHKTTVYMQSPPGAGFSSESLNSPSSYMSSRKPISNHRNNYEFTKD